MAARRIILTRGARADIELAEAAQAAQAEVLSLPCLASEPVSVQMPEAAPDYVLVVSPRSAEALLAQWPEHWRGQQLAAVGPGTAAVLERAGHQVLAPRGEAGISALLALLPAQLEDQRFALIGSEAMRPLLATELQRRGAVIDRLEIIRSFCPPQLQSDLDALSDFDGRQLMLQFSVRALHCLGDAASAPRSELLAGMDCLVPAPRLRATAVGLGFARVHIASAATGACMREAMLSWLAAAQSA